MLVGAVNLYCAPVKQKEELEYWVEVLGSRYKMVGGAVVVGGGAARWLGCAVGTGRSVGTRQ